MKRNLKKALSVILAAAIMICSAPLAGFVGLELPEKGGFKKLADSVSEFFEGLSAKAEATTSGTCGENLTWTLDTETGELVISGTGAMTDWRYGSAVSWTDYTDSIKSVSFSEGVTTIGSYAFYSCDSLASITMSENLISIGSYAFYDCDSLASITIPDNVTVIGKDAFSWCDVLASVTFGNGVLSIGERAFYYCKSLASITIPDNVTTIGESAFDSCGSLASVSIGNGVTSIGGKAFNGCSGLTGISVEPENTGYSSDENGVLFNKDKTLLIRYPAGSAAETYTIPDSVRSIGKYAFSGCKSLTSLTIPEGVTAIDNDVFYGCNSLVSITIPDGVTSIGNYAFYSCDNLTDITMSENLISIGNYAFAYCDKIKNVLIPASVTSIGEDAFRCCDILKNITVDPANTVYSSDENGVLFNKEKTMLIKCPDGRTGMFYTVPDGVTAIGDYAFYDSKLVSIEISDSVITIGKNVFSWCYELKSVIIGSGITTIGYYAFNGCDNLSDVYYSGTSEEWRKITVDSGNDCLTSAAFYYDYDPGKIFYYTVFQDGHVSVTSCIESKLENGVLEIPSTIEGHPVTAIEREAFDNYSTITKVIIPDSVTDIGYRAFYNCPKLSSVTVGNGAIDSRAFEQCYKLSEIIIGNGVTQISYGAFLSCSSLSDVYYMGTKEEWNEIYIGSSNDLLNSATMHYIDNLSWTWSFDEETGTLAIEGTGEMTDWSSNTKVPWNVHKNAIRTVDISDGITRIGNCALSGLTGITHISLPDSVTSIGKSSFEGCTNLTSIDIPAGVKTIPYHAFYNCTSLESVTLCVGLETVGDSAFRGCENLTDITLPDGITEIGVYAFNGTGVYNDDSNWENGVLYIGDYLIGSKYSELPEEYSIKDGTALIAAFAFESCGFTGVIIPDSVKYIGNAAFSYCENLKKVTMGKNVISIGSYAFEFCASLTSVTVSENLEYIDESAFAGCESLSKITLYEKLKYIGPYVFTDTNNYNGINVTFIGTEEKWNAISKADNVFASVVFIRDISNTESSGSNNIMSYAELDEAYDNFIYVGLQVYEADGNLTDYVVSPGDTLEFRYYIKSDLAIGASQLIETFDASFFDVTSVGTNATINAYGYTGSGNGTYNPNHPMYTERPFTTKLQSNNMLSHSALRAKSGLDEAYLASNDYVINAIAATTTQGTQPFTMTSDEWFVSYTVKVKDDVTNGETGVAESLPLLWKSSLLSNGTYNTSMPGNISSALWDSSPAVGSCRPLNTAVTGDILDHFIIGDLKHEFTAEVINPTVTWNIDGVETVVEYTSGDSIIVPEIPEKEYHTFVGWVDENGNEVTIPETMPFYSLTFTAVYEFTGGSCGENVSFSFDKETGIVTISGEGAITASPWSDVKGNITSVVIGEGVTSIPDNAFENCSLLERVTLPVSLVSIGNSAFTGNEKLNDVYYADDDVLWDAIEIGTGNDSLAAADIHFTYFPEDMFTYTIANGEATVTGYNANIITDGVIVIPEVLEGCPVTAIGTKAFYEKTEIVSVTVPSCVKTIGVSAFGKCTSLASITMSEGLQTIDKTAFTGCSALTEITIPEGVTSIGSSAFINCTSLTTVNLSSTVTSVTPTMFSGCNALSAINASENNSVYSSDENGVLFNKDKTVLVFYPMGKTETDYTVPDGVTQIGNSAFRSAKNLTIVTVPEGVTSIGTTAFAVCSSLVTVNLPISLVNIANGAFNSCNALTHVYYSGMKFDWNKITIGSSNEPLNNAVFHAATEPEYYLNYTVVNDEYVRITGCNTSLLINGRLFIPETLDGYPVKQIDSWAFDYMPEIKDIILPDVPLDIGTNAFYGTGYYKNSANWENDALYIGNHLIEVNSLVNKAFTVKDGTISIADYAIGNSLDIVTVHLPVSVKYVGYDGIGYRWNLDYVFYKGTRAQWDEIVFENEYSNSSVYFDYLDSGFENGYIYYYTTDGKAIITEADDSLSGVVDIPETLGGYPVTEIGEYAFSGNHYNITQVNIPDTVTHIGDYAFAWCYGLTSVTIGNGVRSIGENAFWACNLNALKIPDSVETIGSKSFGNNDYLESVSIGSGLSYLPVDAFSGCVEMESVGISADNPNYISEDGVVFSKDKKTLVLYPAGKEDGSFEIPAETENITVGAFYQNYHLLSITVNANNNTFTSVDGVLFSKDKSVLVIYPSGKDGSVYNIPDTVTTVASGAFYISNDYYEGLVRISIPDSVTLFEEDAFYFSSNLSAVYYQGTEEEWDALTENFYSYDFGSVYYNTVVGDDAFGLIYNFTDGEAAVIGYSVEPKGKLVIPSEIDGCPVVSVGRNTFDYCGGITNVIIGDNVTEIGYEAFRSCYGITNITIGSSVETIDAYAFYYCIGLKSVTIPESVKYIGDYAFYDCDYLADLTIGEGVEEIGSYAFYYCRKLTSLTIPDSVKTVGEGAFNSCHNLKTVKIGKRAVLNNSFRYCSSLESFEVSEGSLNYSAENGVLYTSDKSALKLYPGGKKDTSFEIPASVENISNGAFDEALSIESFTVNEENDYLVSIDGVLFTKDESTLVLYPRGNQAKFYVIPDGVTTIATHAFRIWDYCGLNTVSIPKSVVVFEDGAFYFDYTYLDVFYAGSEEEWNALTEYFYNSWGFDNVYFNSSAGKTENGLIYYINENSDAVIIGSEYESIASLTVPATVDGYPVKKIEDEAFAGYLIISLTIENGVEEIGTGAFRNCYLLTSVTIPDSVTSLSKSAFYSCDELETVKIGSGVTEIYENTFADCYKLKSYEISESNTAYSSDESGVLFNKDKTRLISYPMGKTEESYEIPASITEIAPYALQGNANLKAITVDNNNEAYASVDGVLYSKDLKTLVCYPLGKPGKMCIIPDHVTTIATGAILRNGDSSFNKISIPKTVTTLEERAIITNYSFYDVFFGGSEAEWSALHEQNGEYINSNNIHYNCLADEDSCGLTYYIRDDSEAVIIGADETVKGDYVIPSTLGGYPVTEISDDAFSGKAELTGITIPETVIVIGEEAFAYSGLTEVIIPDSVIYVDDYAFSFCVNLESVELPETLQMIGGYAFALCAKLESVNIPRDTVSIGYGAFRECINLREFTVAEGNEYFVTDENGVLYSADKTRIVQYPLNSSAAEFTIPDTVTKFESELFMNAQNLKTLSIPASVTDIGDGEYFYLGKNFERYIVDESNPLLSSDEQGALYDKNKTILVSCPPAIADKNFVIPDTVEEVLDFSFAFCDDLVITIPDSLTMGELYDALPWCSAKEYIVSETHPDLAVHKGALYTKDKTALIKYPTDSDADIHVAPETLELIGETAFITPGAVLIQLYPSVALDEDVDLDKLTKVCDNLTLHTAKPIYTFGLKQLCVSEADEADILSANEELAEIFSDIREEYEVYLEYSESPSSDYFEKLVFSSMVPMYERLLNIADSVTVCAGNHNDVHIHEWVETVVNETCTDDGSITNVCSVCDEVTVEVIPACHKPGEWITVTEPTTKAEGKKAKFCTVCEETVEEEILPKLDIPVTGIDLRETEAEIENYTSVQLNASTVPADCNNTKILWSSSNESVARVDENGVVSAVSVGDAVITATTEEGGFTAECAVTVVPAQFTVTLNIDGVQSFVTFKEGAAISVENPVKEGYTFVEWLPAMPEIMPSENLEFTAVFEINTYTVEWDIDGLTLHESYQYGASIDKTKTFTKKGYTFAGWTPEIPDTMPANNLAFTATWTANLYDAVFFTNGGVFPDGDSIKRLPTAYNSPIAVPENPVKQGYEFMGWAYNGRNIGTNAGIMTSVDGMEFEAIWASNNTAKYKIETYTMNTAGGYEKSSITLSGNVYDNVSVTPEAETGFVLNEEKSVLSGTVLVNEIIVLKVYYDRLSYNLTVNIDGVKETVSYYYGEMISPLQNPVKEGFEFVGWDKEIPSTMPANDITVTAKFKVKEEDKTSAKISISTPEKRTLYYGESITLYASAKNLPEGAVIKWYVEGDGVSIKPSSNGKSCKVTSTSNGNVVIRATVLDAKGNTIKGSNGKPVSDYEYLYSEVNLWQMIVSFFRNLFGAR